jgi:hypothetical protein
MGNAARLGFPDQKMKLFRRLHGFDQSGEWRAALMHIERMRVEFFHL